MNAQQLKNSILQEAIEGRLVPQDPNDEPASVLLDKIRKEKARLVKEGKLKKKDLEEAPISEEEKPFEIPESWEWTKIGTIFNHSSGKQLSGSNTEGSLREYITTSNLYWGRFELDNLKSMYYKESELEKCTAKQGDLLVCEGGDIGRSAIWPYDYDICLQNHVHRLRPYDNRYTVFVFYIMWYYKSIGLIGGKGIGIQGLSASALKSISIPLPPLAEQKRIVAKIEELLPKVEEYGKAQESLDKLNEELSERLKKSILQEAIEGRLVPQDPNDEPASVLVDKIRKEKARLVKHKIIKPDKNDSLIYKTQDGRWMESFEDKNRPNICIDDEIPFQIPESWEWARLGSLLQLVSDGTHKTPNYVDSGIPFLSVQNISSGKLTMDKIKFITEGEHKVLIKRVKPSLGDILICRIGTLGKALKIYWDFEFSIFVSLGLLRPIDEKLTDYLVFCINSPLGFNWIQNNKVGGGTHTFKINLGDMPNMLIPIPPYSEQKRIGTKIEQLLHEIDKLKV